MERKLFRFNRIRTQIRLFLPTLFLLISIIFIVLGVSDATSFVKTRKFFVELLYPIVRIVQTPVYWVKNGALGIKNWTLTYVENERLKQENAELLKWQALAFEYKTKMEELQKHLKYVFPSKSTQLMADIVIDEASAFSRSFIVMAGEQEGVKKGMLAYGPKTLMGRIIEVGNHYSYVMPLTDYHSRLPVWVGAKRIEAFLIGDNTQTPYLQLIHTNEAIQPGDLVMTSGYLGVYPADIVLGFVKSVQEDDFKVALYENGSDLSVVRLVDYHFSKSVLLEEKNEAD